MQLQIATVCLLCPSDRTAPSGKSPKLAGIGDVCGQLASRLNVATFSVQDHKYNLVVKIVISLYM